MVTLVVEEIHVTVVEVEVPTGFVIDDEPDLRSGKGALVVVPEVEEVVNVVVPEVEVVVVAMVVVPDEEVVV